MPVAKLEPALDVVVISWRMGACDTMAEAVGVWARLEIGTDRDGFTEGERRRNVSECDILCSPLLPSAETRSRLVVSLTCSMPVDSITHAPQTLKG